MFPKSLFDRDGISSPSKGPKSPPHLTEGSDARPQGSFFSQLVRNSSSRSSFPRDTFPSPSFSPLIAQVTPPTSSQHDGKGFGGGRRSPAPLKEADLVSILGHGSPVSSPRSSSKKETPKTPVKDNPIDFLTKSKSKNITHCDHSSDVDTREKSKTKKSNRSRSPPHKSQLVERKASNPVVDGLDLHVSMSTSSTSSPSLGRKSPQRIFFKLSNPSASKASLRTNSSYFSEDPTQCSEFVSSSESSSGDEWKDDDEGQSADVASPAGSERKRIFMEQSEESIDSPKIEKSDTMDETGAVLKQRIRERRKKRREAERPKKDEEEASVGSQESHVKITMSSSCGSISQNGDIVPLPSSAPTSDCSAEMNDNIDNVAKSSSSLTLALSNVSIQRASLDSGGRAATDEGRDTPDTVLRHDNKSFDQAPIEKRSPAKKPASLSSIARPIPKGNTSWKKDSDSSDGRRRTQRDLSPITETMNPLFAIGRENEMGRFGQIVVTSEGKGTLESVSLWIIQFLKAHNDPQWKVYMIECDFIVLTFLFLHISRIL